MIFRPEKKCCTDHHPYSPGSTSVTNILLGFNKSFVHAFVVQQKKNNKIYHLQVAKGNFNSHIIDSAIACYITFCYQSLFRRHGIENMILEELVKIMKMKCKLKTLWSNQQCVKAEFSSHSLTAEWGWGPSHFSPETENTKMRLGRKLSAASAWIANEMLNFVKPTETKGKKNAIQFVMLSILKCKK